MKSVKIQKECTIEKKYYSADKEINVHDLSFETIVNLNEKGFIYPLNRQELEEIKEELEKPNKISFKKEEE